MDEHAWNELVAQYPKVAPYNTPKDTFPFYEQMLDMFRGKFATCEDDVSVNNIIRCTSDSPVPVQSEHNHTLVTPNKKLLVPPIKIDPSLTPKYANGKNKRRKGNVGVLLDLIKAVMKLVENKASNANMSMVDHAVKILHKMGINDDTYIMDIGYLGEEKSARTFVAMDEDKRKLILGKKFNATFDVVPAENMDADTIVNINTDDNDKSDLDIE
eukprot:jgi/Psemu1/35790/gm1.35790_g